MRKVSKIPTLLAIALLTLGIFSGVILINNKQIFRLGASVAITPKDVRITNITEESFAVSWTTDSKTLGRVEWGGSKSSTNKVAQSITQSPSFTHWVLIRNLIPNESYFFKIVSNERGFDNNGTLWQIKTASSIPSKEPNVISGTVVNQDSTPSENALVYVYVAGGTPLSTTTSADGAWLIPISMARTQTLDSYVEINQNTLIEISVQAGPAVMASAQIYPEAAKPAPAISLGKIHNFKNIKTDNDGQVPDASINLPDEEEGSSGFLLDDEEETEEKETVDVTLENISEGEVVNTSNPFFEGQGPAGSTITITVESEPISELIEVDEDGNWSWNPPAVLENGEHKISIQWKDAKGVLRILTRSFIVAAANAESLTPTPTLTPTATSTPTPTLTATSTPTSIPTATDANLPAAGVLTPTILLITMSLTSIAFGGLVFSFYFEKPQNSKR
jgi:hypothetical protein